MMTDDPEAISAVDNVISFEQFRAERTKDDSALDDDELIRRAGEKIAKWKAAGTPSLTEVQELFHDSICAGASPMAPTRWWTPLSPLSAPSLVGSERC
jgi:hypothetical protein